MPTRDRPEFAAQAVRYFLPGLSNPELVVVDDGEGLAVAAAGRPANPLDPRRSGSPTGRPEHRRPAQPRRARPPRERSSSTGTTTTGTGRRGCRTRWIPSCGAADVTGLPIEWFEPSTRRAWRLTPELHRTHAPPGRPTAGRSLPPGRCGSGTAFPTARWLRTRTSWSGAVRGGARLLRLPGKPLIYVRHEHNTWRFDTRASGAARRLDSQSRALRCLRQDLALLRRAWRGRLPTDRIPLVSCIMPTRDRRAFVAQAIDYFLRQDYPAKELIILDDGEDPVATWCRTSPDPLPPARPAHGARREAEPRLRAGRRRADRPLGRRRLAGARRLSAQAARLERRRADLCGAGSLLFWDPAAEPGVALHLADGPPRLGGRHQPVLSELAVAATPFAEVPIGEDTRFVWRSAVRRLADVRDENCVVGLVHPHNTVPKTGRGAYWARQVSTRWRATSVRTCTSTRTCGMRRRSRRPPPADHSFTSWPFSLRSGPPSTDDRNRPPQPEESS